MLGLGNACSDSIFGFRGREDMIAHDLFYQRLVAHAVYVLLYLSFQTRKYARPEDLQGTWVGKEPLSRFRRTRKEKRAVEKGGSMRLL